MPAAAVLLFVCVITRETATVKQIPITEPHTFIVRIYISQSTGDYESDLSTSLNDEFQITRTQNNNIKIAVERLPRNHHSPTPPHH